MKYRVEISEEAEADTREAYRWWATHHSPQQAERWLSGIRTAILGLDTMPEQHGLANETALRLLGIRQAAFGLGRRPSHRIVFGIEGDTIIVYRVRSFRQDAIGVDDLAE